MSRLSYRIGLLHLLLALPVVAGAAPPSDGGSAKPWTQLFVAPSGEPFRAGPGEPYPVATWFAAADTNRDGKLTESEFMTDVMRFYDSLDGNHDQQLSAVEIQHYETDIVPEARTGTFGEIDWNVGQGAKANRAGKPALGLMQIETDDLQAHVPELWRRHDDGYAGSGASKYGIIAIPEPIMGMDTDLNGIVNRREMLAAAQRRFRILDTDEKNFLVLRELPETYAQSHPSKMNKKR